VLTGGEDGALSLLELRALAKPARAAMQPASEGGTAHTSRVEALAWMPDDNRLFLSGAGSCVKVWDASAPQESVISLELGTVNAIAVGGESAGPEAAVALGDHTVRVLDLRLGRCVRTMQGHTQPPLCVAWGAPGTQRLYSAGLDGTVRAWDSRMGARSLFSFDPFAHEETKPVLKKLLSEEETLAQRRPELATLRARQAEVERRRGAANVRFEPYRLKGMQDMLRPGPGSTKERVSQGSLTPGTGTGGLWGSPASKEMLPLSRIAAGPSAERSQQLAEDAAERARHFLEPPRREYEHEPHWAHRGAVISLSFALPVARLAGATAAAAGRCGTERRLLLSCGVDGKVRCWDAATGTPVKGAPTLTVNCWSKDLALPLSAQAAPEDVCFVPEQEATAVYCLRTGELICRLKAHSGAVTAVEAVAGAGRVLTCSNDGRLLCWQASQGGLQGGGVRPKPVIHLD